MLALVPVVWLVLLGVIFEGNAVEAFLGGNVGLQGKLKPTISPFFQHQRFARSSLPSSIKPEIKTSQDQPQRPDESLIKELMKFRRNKYDGAQLAHQRLELAMKDRDPTIDEKSFNTVFLAYATQSGRGDWMAPLRSEQLLQKMKRYPTVRPSVFSYNAVMEAWVKSATQKSNKHRKKTPKNRSQDPSKSQSKKEPSFPKTPHPSQQPKQRSIVQAKNAVMRLFLEMAKAGEATLQPDTYTYNLVLELFAKSPSPEDLEKAMEWFRNMSCEPDLKTFNLLFAAHGKHGNAQEAEQLLHDLIREIQEDELPAEEENRPLVPRQVWFHCVLKAYAQDQKKRRSTDSTTFDFGAKADQLLEAMQFLYKDEGLESVRPDASTFNHALNVHAQLGNIARVKELLRELEDLYFESPDRMDLAPDRITYTTALKAYANSASHSDIHEAEELFQRMLDLAAAGRRNMSPSIVSYNTMIQIWSRTGLKEHILKATDLLKEMQQQPSTSPQRSTILLPAFPRPPPPISNSFTTILHGWSKTRNCREAGYKAEELLHMLERLPPNARRNLNWSTVYNSVITAWSKSGDKAAPQRVESLLNLLEDKCYRHDSGGTVGPDKTTFLCIADTYAKARIPDAEQRCDDLLVRMKQLEEAGVVSSDLRSNRALYNSILNALAKSGQPSSKDKAEEILTMMQTSPNKDLRPDIVTYATVIDCYTKSGSAGTADRAEELLRFVEGSYRNGDTLLKPNAVFYSAILQAWAKTQTMQGAERAEWLLRRNEGLYKQGHDYYKPHPIMYNAVMDSIARSGMADSGVRAEELLGEIMSLYEAGDEQMKPTRRSFNAVMLAYRYDGQGAEKAEKLLDTMEDLADTGDFPNIMPDVVAYNCAIHAIVDERSSTTKPVDWNAVASRAQALLDRMEERCIRPDATTYSCVIEAWLKCHDEKGSVMAELMLQKFLDLVETTKDWESKPDTEMVWDVINAYRDTD
ncbi:Pentatricopeptide repeat-containing protein [Seminavis robusta]|uniref:Pentatricopeptide repeat-containing protein n=1 Tax=Seminavis robusta TaxID=568900 RepID=A0A9N8H4M8_9STRA|nr:Pentatricopeptide repeat-containing protein [Seminavis robusta]|eukprot:Sro54_g031790.1 Pentatricopeptide repeat-containing protein (975) ;mRNA; r:43806-46730